MNTETSTFMTHAENLRVNPQASIVRIDTDGIHLEWCVNDPSGETLQLVGLSEFEVAPCIERRRRYLQQALDNLANWNRYAYECIQNFTSSLIWLRLKTLDAAVPLFSSTSFYEFPHCTFLTDLALYHIPPDIVFSVPMVYALRENLYHEALHQQLCTLISKYGVFTDPTVAHALPGILIPWRNTYWKLEHALQAAFVYSKVARTRIAAYKQLVLDDPQRSLFRLAIQKAYDSLRVLRDGLVAHHHYFNPSSLSIIGEIDSAVRTMCVPANL